MPPTKVQLNIRLTESGVEWIAKKAAEHGVTQTDVIKAALAMAATSKDSDIDERLAKIHQF